jgi:ribosomal protein L22
MKDKKDLQKEKEKDSEKETKQTTPPPEENKIEEKTSQPPKKKETKDQDMSRGAPSEESVFGGTDGLPPAEADGAEAVEKPVHEEIEPEALMNVLNPEPGKTMAWQRKKLIQQIRNRGALTKEQQLARTERSCTVPSALFRTSTKKLVHLARQIAGKPIEEAIVQMQLSRKKVAQDIRQHLEYARNLAIVSRGMGLGKVEGREGEAVEIELKDGKRKIIKDRTGIYVEQAWVNKGEERMTPEYRGRGRVFTLTHRSASEFISVT